MKRSTQKRALIIVSVFSLGAAVLPAVPASANASFFAKSPQLDPIHPPLPRRSNIHPADLGKAQGDRQHELVSDPKKSYDTPYTRQQQSAMDKAAAAHNNHIRNAQKAADNKDPVTEANEKALAGAQLSKYTEAFQNYYEAIGQKPDGKLLETIKSPGFAGFLSGIGVVAMATGTTYSIATDQADKAKQRKEKEEADAAAAVADASSAR